MSSSMNEKMSKSMSKNKQQYEHIYCLEMTVARMSRDQGPLLEKTFSVTFLGTKIVSQG